MQLYASCTDDEWSLLKLIMSYAGPWSTKGSRNVW